MIWSTPQFGFVRLSDAFTTGSSIMPQKKNPDAAELVRAKTGRVIGASAGAADRHEGPAARLFQGHAGGQGAVFDAVDALELTLRGDGRHGRRPGRPTPRRCGAPPAPGFSTATDLADWLVRELGLPFREAHHVTGAPWRWPKPPAAACASLPLADLQALDPADHRGRLRRADRSDFGREPHAATAAPRRPRCGSRSRAGSKRPGTSGRGMRKRGQNSATSGGLAGSGLKDGRRTMRKHLIGRAGAGARCRDAGRLRPQVRPRHALRRGGPGSQGRRARRAAAAARADAAEEDRPFLLDRLIQ